MSINGTIIQQQRNDILVRPMNDHEGILFIYTGIVGCDFQATTHNTTQFQLVFDPNEGEINETQLVKGLDHVGIVLTPVNWNANLEFHVLSIDNPKVIMRPVGHGLRVCATVSLQGASLFRIAYHLTVLTNIQ